MFSFDIPLSSIILLAASAIPALFLLSFYLRRIRCVSKHRNACDNAAIPDNLPPVSIVIYTDNDPQNLAELLPDILAQDYPAEFEVIVVNDGSSEDVKDIVKGLSLTHSNIYTTHTPDEARYLSRKKLSLTIGIKAARHNHLIFTRSNCRIKSRLWLASMARHFAEGKEVVIGYASHSPADDKLFGARLRAFNITANAIAYISSAIRKKPYRGIDANIGYSRELFYRNNGFSQALNLHYGDDDILISEIATATNTGVELSDNSHVDIKYRRHVKDSYRDQWNRYNFTAQYLRKWPRRLFAMSSLVMWLWLCLSLCAILTSMPNLLPAVIVAGITLVLWIPLAIAWHKTSAALNSRKFLLSTPLLALLRPIHNIRMKIRSIPTRNSNFTWQKI